MPGYLTRWQINKKNISPIVFPFFSLMVFDSNGMTPFLRILSKQGNTQITFFVDGIAIVAITHTYTFPVKLYQLGDPFTHSHLACANSCTTMAFPFQSTLLYSCEIGGPYWRPSKSAVFQAPYIPVPIGGAPLLESFKTDSQQSRAACS